MSPRIHSVLWTSGWDSTFRVLDLVLKQKVYVRPYYVIAPERRGTKMEMASMEAIREGLSRKDPDAAKRVLPTIFYHKNHIQVSIEMRNTFQSLLKKGHIGDQYLFLASLVKNENIRDLELCIHVDDKFVNFIGSDDFNDFSVFSLPLLRLTKLEMQAYAEKNGFADLMEITWFCHDPRGSNPCGYCKPCQYTREEGLGRRVPPLTWFRRVRRRFEEEIRINKKRIKGITTRD